MEAIRITQASKNENFVPPPYSDVLDAASLILRITLPWMEDALFKNGSTIKSNVSGWRELLQRKPHFEIVRNILDGSFEMYTMIRNMLIQSVAK